MALRLIFCADGISPHAFGGMARHARLLLEALAKTGELDIIAVHPHKTGVFDKELNIKEISIEGINTQKNYLMETYRYSKRIYSVLEKYPDYVIYSQGLCVWFGIRRFSRRLIINPHGLDSYQFKNFRQFFMGLPFRIIFNYLFSRSAKVISLGGRLSDILKNNIKDDSRIAVLPNGVNLPEDQGPGQRFSDSSGSLKVLFLGRFVHSKGIGILLRAAKELNEEGYEDKISYYFGGTGPLSQYYSNNFNFNNIKFLGQVFDQQLPDLFKSSDLFVLPSVTEGMPMAVLEAMSYGLPVIASETGAINELVNSSNGYVVKINNTGELKKAIISFYHLSPEEKNRLAENSYLKIKNDFTWKALIGRYMEVFRELAKNYACRGCGDKGIKVAFLTEIPTPYRDSLFEELNLRRDLCFEALYCARREAGRDWEQEQKNYPYRILPGLNYPFVGKNIFALKLNPGIWGQLSSRNYGAVIIGGYVQPTMQLAIAWCLRNKVPYILLSESHNLTPRGIFRQISKWPLVRFSVKMAAAFLATGSNSRDYLVSYGADPSKVFLFPNAPDVKRLAKESLSLRDERERLRKELKIPGRQVVLYSGRLIGCKNVDTLLRAFRLARQEAPDAGLVIAGDGPLGASLKNLSAELKLNNIHFAGFIQPKDLVKYYSCCDVFVLPSHDEPWGVVVLEAMACGLPVIVSEKVGCGRDLVQPDKNGFIFDAKNERELAGKIVRLLSDPGLRAQMGGRSREIAGKWDYEFCFAQLMQALKRIGVCAG